MNNTLHTPAPWKIATFRKPVQATMLRWGSHPVPDCNMIPGEYVRLAPRKWAVWLGESPSSKYIYQVPKTLHTLCKAKGEA